MLDKDKYDVTKSKPLRLRYAKSMNFILANTSHSETILDIGAENPFSKLLSEKGFKVINTEGKDLDLNPEQVAVEADLAIALEILEHLVNPFSVLKTLKAKRLIASVPLNLWFAKAYRHSTNEWDRHYHEFEQWQFDWLLNKAGWKIVRREKWISPVYQIGWRPLLRFFVPRYYIVEAVKAD
ncbi:MAG TPA: methyltransferase [Cyclobacteriaceae bacterium]|nr:methyltransferase [Cyclobacteriaceae bacterium]